MKPGAGTFGGDLTFGEFRKLPDAGVVDNACLNRGLGPLEILKSAPRFTKAETVKNRSFCASKRAQNIAKIA